MTVKLYDENTYQTTCEAVVLSCEEINSDSYQLILDQTIFFPEEGGQTPDKGTIAGFNVTDVQISGDIITHTISASGSTLSLPKVGDTVSCKLNWQHRFSNMQQHTGEHIFSGLVYAKFGYDNVGFHLSDSIVTMDYNGPISEEDILELETKSNEAIFEGHAITCYYPTDKELASLNYRSKKELTGPIRIVDIEGTDICACCAPHVKNTSEVGILKVLDVTNYKGGVRLSILCGMRALENYRLRLNQCIDISHTTSQPLDDITSAVEKLKDDCGTLRHELSESKKQLLASQAKELDANAKDVFLFTDHIDANIMRYQINELTELHPGYCGIFNASEDGFTFIIGSKEKDCNILIQKLRENIQAKGGGKPEMVQGSLTASKEDILSLLNNI